jgi:preprotein translocase subunit SecG
MIFGLVLVIHILVALFLIGVVLLQGGRGGLGEALGGAAAQSLFGGSANTVMTKLTAIVAGVFMVTCLSLAALSTARGRSVIERLPASVDELPVALPATPPQGAAPSDETPSPTPSAQPPAPPQ